MMVSRLHEFPSLLALVTEEVFQPLNPSSEGVMHQTLTRLIAFDDPVSLSWGLLWKLMDRELVFPLLHASPSLAEQSGQEIAFFTLFFIIKRLDFLRNHQEWEKVNSEMRGGNGETMASTRGLLSRARPLKRGKLGAPFHKPPVMQEFLFLPSSCATQGSSHLRRRSNLRLAVEEITQHGFIFGVHH